MIKIDIICNVGGASGYDVHARALVKAIAPHVDLRLPLFGQNHLAGALSDAEMVYYSNFSKPNRVPDVTLHFQIPTLWRPNPSSKNIGVFPWETSRIPCRPIVVPNLGPPEYFNWVAQCNTMDEIWTFSKAAVAAIKATGVTKPVHLIPGPFDFDKFSTIPKDLPAILNVTNQPNGTPITIDKKFVVSCVGEWTLRKNIDSFLKCCFVGLPAGRTVIVLKSNAPNYKPDVVAGEISKLKNSMKLPVVPQVVLIDELVDDSIIKSILYHSDVFVTLSKGEGFDLPLLQAMSLGKVCVSGMNSAHLDYVENNVNGIGIPCVPELIAYPDDGLNNCHLNYSGDQIWHKPNEIDFVMNIQKLYQEWEKDNSLSSYDKMKSNAKEKVKKLYGIEGCGKVCDGLLRQLCGVP